MSVTSGTKTEGGFGETVRVVIHALLIALVIRTFLFQPFNIPSGSMKATLLVGDYLFVSKFSYGYSHYSIPFSPPLFSGRIFGSDPQRGDIVVFRLPKDDSTDYIKRVIGLPGDRVQMRDGVLQINGKAVARERLPDFVGEDPCGSDTSTPVKRWKETLPNGVKYMVLDSTPDGLFDNVGPLVDSTIEDNRRNEIFGALVERADADAIPLFAKAYALGVKGSGQVNVVTLGAVHTREALRGVGWFRAKEPRTFDDGQRLAIIDRAHEDAVVVVRDGRAVPADAAE